MNTQLDFKAQELSSRKLWDIVSHTDDSDSDTPAADLMAAIAELALRRHYLSELEALGKFSASSH